MTINDKIYHQIADKMDLNKSKVEEAVKSMFTYLVHHMENGDIGVPVRMQYLGIWQCKPTRVAKLKEKGLL